MSKIHGIGIAEIEDMMPWERLVYTDLAANWMKEEQQTRIDMANAMKDLSTSKVTL